MADRGAFVVPVHDLDLAGRSVRFPNTPAWLRGALEGCEPQPAGSTGQLDAHLTKTGNDVLVQGQIDAAIVIPCARCLTPVEVRPHVELSLLLVPATGAAAARKPGAHGPGAPAKPGPGHGRSSGKEHVRVPPRAAKSDDETEFDAEDADIDTYDGEEVVLDRFVREAILLESPIFPLCSEACEGIRPASDSAQGSEGAVTDPRLLPLLELAKRRKMKE
jgi:uncharacterized protein